MKKKKNLKLVKPNAAAKIKPLKKKENSLEITPAERAEIARFKALTLQRAKRKAVVRRLIAKLQEREKLSDAA